MSNNTINNYKRSIEDINKRIADGEATILTAHEFKDLVKERSPPKLEEVDVVTCGTCGVMSGTTALFNLTVSEAGVFKKAKKMYLNGVPAFTGPCPNEWLGSVDAFVYGTSHSINDHNYGGGFLFKDLLEGKEISIKLESIDGDIIESTTTLSEMGKAHIIGTRMAFKNYTAFTNPGKSPVSSIFNAIPLDGEFKALSFSGCGEINPVQNDPNLFTITEGTKILLNGASAMVLGQGTRSSDIKPNIMLSGDMHKMDSDYIGGFKTGEGPEVYDSVAIPIPVLNQDIFNNLMILNNDIPLTVADVKGRHLPLTETDYGKMWDNHDERPVFESNMCINCASCLVEERCPTLAFNNRELNTEKCFGCGMCLYSCPGFAFKMDIGAVDLNVNSKEVNVSIACRQSDILRAKKISTQLKEMIINKEFFL